MSRWTHVAGIIRIDSIMRHMKPVTEPDLGRIISWEDMCDADEEDSIVPIGSEGSLHWSFEKTGSESSVSWGNLHISGDLRDYEDDEAIIEWIKSSTQSNDWFIRQAIITIEVEGNAIKVLHKNYSEDWAIVN